MPNAEGFLLPGLEADFVIAAHDEIIARSGGLPGLAHGGSGGVESALQRASNHALYADVGEHDVLSMAALYAVSIARGHVFNDGNKRTALTCALAFCMRTNSTLRKRRNWKT